MTSNKPRTAETGTSQAYQPAHQFVGVVLRPTETGHKLQAVIVVSTTMVQWEQFLHHNKAITNNNKADNF